jgi:Zn-dependent M28 family amino/carboxypeptidase
MLKRRVVALSVVLSLLSLPIAAQNGSGDMLSRIRREATDHSQIMRTVHMFTDLYGPRLTGSPNHKAAAEWAIKQMTAWGLENAHLEPWDFKHPGWLNERLTAHLIAPVKDPLVCEVLAWTPSTKGIVQANALQLILPDRVTQDQLKISLNNYKAQVREKIVLVGKPAAVPINLTPPAKRLNDEQALQRFGPNPRTSAAVSPTPTPDPNAPRPLSNRQVNEQLDAFLKENGALVRVNDAGREFRQIRAFNNPTFDVNKVIPTVVMSNEDFGRIARILNDGTAVVLEFKIVNHVYPEGSTTYNTVAEIPGSDKAGEVIMLGGHLDSWHAATGATDNAIGCAIMMEAARILKTLGVKPRRTIRVALWSGEEEGLLGSSVYVKEHFGTFEDPKPGYEKLGGYINIDTGTGRLRGASVFGPPETANIMREIVAPFKADGVVGVVPTRSRRRGGSDHTSFNEAGLPGISMVQDPIEYSTHTWHTNLDTYERILEDDVKQAAMVVAWSIYQLAMRDELLPRFAKGDIPPKAAAPETSSQPATRSVRPDAEAKPRAQTTTPHANKRRSRG